MNIEFRTHMEYEMISIGTVFATRDDNEVYIKIQDVVRDDCTFRCVRLRDGLLEDFNSKELVKILNSKLVVW